jgi:hypothetical protein
MKKTLSIILMLAMLLSAFTFMGAVTPVAAATTLGDINGDGAINAKDSLLLKKYVACINVSIVSAASDLNADTAINSKDCRALREFLAGAIASFGSSTVSSDGIKKLTIAGNDISTYDIVSMRPADGYRARDCYAYGVRQFKNIVSWATGYTLNITGNSSALSSNGRFSGDDGYNGTHLSSTQPHHIYMIWEDSELGDQGYSWEVDENDDLIIRGGYRTGIMNSTYDFVDEYCGYRCYQLGGQDDVGEVIIPADHVNVPAGLKKTYIPTFSYRDIATSAWNSSNGYADQEVAGLCAANHINATEDKAFAANAKFGFGYGNVWIHAHSFGYIFSDLGHGTQPCLSNWNNRIHASAWWKGTLAERLTWEQSIGYELRRVSISWNDNTNFCLCSDCVATYRNEQSLAGTIVPFVNYVIDDIRNSYDVRAYYIAYGPARIPPKYARPNQYCDISYCWNGCNNHLYASNDCDDIGNTKGWTNWKERYYFEFWAKICDNLEGWYYSTTYSWNIGPCPNILNIREDFRYWADHGVKYLYAEAEGDATMSFEPLRNNMMARCAWNPYMSEAEFQQRIDEFMEYFYGEGWRNIKEYLYISNEAGNRAGCFTNNYDWPGDMYDISYMYQNYDHMCTLFNNAKQLATNEQRQRIERLSIHMHFMALCGACYVDGNGAIAANSTLSSRYDEMWNYIDQYNFVASVYGQPTRSNNYNKNTSPFASFFDFEDWDNDGRLSGSWWEYYAPNTGRILPYLFKYDPDVAYYYLASACTKTNNPLATWVP